MNLIILIVLDILALVAAFTAERSRVGHLLDTLHVERKDHREQVKDLLDSAERNRLASHEGRERLLDDFSAERQRWESERAVLLNRIQDPPAGVAAAMTLLPAPEPGALDVDFQ